MKILCISDQIDPLVYSPRIKERYSDVDFVLSAGDLPLDYLDFIVSSLNKPVFFIFGNHHTDEIKHYKSNYISPYEKIEPEYLGCGAIYLGNKVKFEGNIILAGLGGSMRYNNGKNATNGYSIILW